MTPFRLIGALALLAPGCAMLSQTSASSNTSGGSSGQSANSSKQSADSSAASGASSQQSSGASSNQSRNSSAAAPSSANSSNATSDAPSTSIVAGSALLLAAAGGIITTVYTVKHRREARLQREQLQRLQQAPVPQPMPYKVEPIPLQPGVTPPPPTPPKSSRLLDDEPTLDALVMARAWLMANELQLKQDLALGAGPSIEDLAGIAGIPGPHRRHFGRVLQAHRAELLTGHEISEADAARVMARVGDLVMADPLLRADGGAALAATW